MGKRSKTTTFAGVDVGGKELVVALVRGDGEVMNLSIPNTPEGHQTLLRALTKRLGSARVVLEATGTYHLDLALLLAASKAIELMVVNPLAARRFAQAQMRRAKTDKVDALVLLEFCQRMPFEAWVQPTPAALALRTVARHLSALIEDQTTLKNRLTAYRATTTTPVFVLDDLGGQLLDLAGRIKACQAEARRVAEADPELKASFESLVSAPGIAERSAVVLLGELAVLDATMTPDEVVGHAGLDPRPLQSGGRGRKDTDRKISKVGNARVRGAMYMVALNAVRDAEVGAFYRRLIERKKPFFVAQVAVMRRMLRVAWVLLVRKKTWDGSLFAPRAPRPTTSPASVDQALAG